MNYLKAVRQNCGKFLLGSVMRRLSFFLFPLSCLATGVGVAIAIAQGMAPSDVTSMLAKSNTLDMRCKILAEADSQDLMDYLARAEILLAEHESVKVARAAMANGKAAGDTASCGPEQTKFVTGVLAAARASTMVESPAQPAMESPSVPALRQTTAEPEPIPEGAPKSVAAADVKVVNAERVVAKSRPKTLASTVAINKKNASSLNAYAGLAQRYYVELKCRSLSGTAVNKLYGNVLASHRKAVAENGPSAVRAVLRIAEARAKAKSC